MSRNSYDMDQKIEACLAWLITGTAEEAGRLCNVPGRTVRGWMQSEWWESILDQARTIKQKELDAVWTALIHKAAFELKDRLDNGDEIVLKSGEVKKVKLKGRDIAIIMSIANDKRAISRGQVTSRTEKVTVEKTLEQIGEKLQEFGVKQLDEPKLQ